MTTATYTDIPTEIFSGLAPDIPASDLPSGASSGAQDVQFRMGDWETRPGLLAAFLLAGNPTVNYQKTFGDASLNVWNFFFDSRGNLWYQLNGSVGLLLAQTGITANSYAQSNTAFTREWFAYGDGKFGIYPPFKCTPVPGTPYTPLMERVSQVGPGAAPTVADWGSSFAINASPGGILPVPGILAADLTQVGNLVTMLMADSFLDIFGADTYMTAVQIGDQFVYAGDLVAGYNGTWTVSAVNFTTNIIEFYVPDIGLPESGGGTVTFGVVSIIATDSTGVQPFEVLGTATVAGSSGGLYDGNYSVRSAILSSTTLTVVGYAPIFSAGNNGDGTLSTVGNISMGKHMVTVMFKTDQGFITAPAVPPTTWTAAGNHQVQVDNIATGPGNVVARLLAFTIAGGAQFFSIEASQLPNFTMLIPDNTTTTAIIDFTDTALAASTNVDEYFNKIELGECSAVVPFSSRLFWFGERNKLNSFVNLTFDGGFSHYTHHYIIGGDVTYDLPLGWQLDPNGDGYGGFQGSAFGNMFAYSIQAGPPSTSTIQGRIFQNAFEDYLGNPLILPSTLYSVRVRLQKTGTVAGGNFLLRLYSPSTSTIYGSYQVSTGLVVGAQAEFIGDLITATYPSFPSDLQLDIALVGASGGGLISIKNIQIFPTALPYNQRIVRASLASDPESYDGESGFIAVNDFGDQRLVTGFQLRKNFYIVAENSLGVTTNNGGEPSTWDVDTISNRVGTPSVHGVAVGEEWAIIVNRNGCYIVWGAPEPVKISQEIQPLWDQINWDAGDTVWCLVDTKNKRILIGVPLGNVQSPNTILYMDYRGLDTAQDIVAYHSVRYSSYSGKILAIGDARKWCPWGIASSSGALLENSDGTTHTFIGNGVNNGKIYDLLDESNWPDDLGTFGDDGVGIPYSYSTYYLPSHADEENYHLTAHRKLYGYLTGYVEGYGTLGVQAQPLGNITKTQLADIAMVTRQAAVNITSVKRFNGVVTVITATPHGLTSTDTQVVLADVTDASFNGTLPLFQVINPTMFQANQFGPNATSIGGTMERLLRDFEQMTNFSCERAAYTFYNKGNQLGSFARFEKLVVSLKTDPYSPVRGVA